MENLNYHSKNDSSYDSKKKKLKNQDKFKSKSKAKGKKCYFCEILEHFIKNCYKRQNELKDKKK